MPWKRNLYPDNWDALSTACKERAQWKCERCSIPMGATRLSREGRPYSVTLTAAHLDHDPANPSPRLQALCENCHLLYDKEHHRQNAAKTRFRKKIESGQLVLGDWFIRWLEDSA